MLSSFCIYFLCLPKSDVLELIIVHLGVCPWRGFDCAFAFCITVSVPLMWPTACARRMTQEHSWHDRSISLLNVRELPAGGWSSQYLCAYNSRNWGNGFSHLLLDRSLLWSSGPGLVPFDKEVQRSWLYLLGFFEVNGAFHVYMGKVRDYGSIYGLDSEDCIHSVCWNRNL